MVMTNIFGIAWTCWTIFGRDEDEIEEKVNNKSSSEKINLTNPTTAMNKNHKTRYLATKFKTWKERRI